MADIDDGTEDTTQPADDIRSQLNAALEESESDAGTESQQQPSGDAASQASATGERVRGPDGKFVKKDEADTAAAAAPKPGADTTKKDDPAAQAAAQAANAASAGASEAPAHWSQADKDKFKAQPADVQSFILDRFKAMEGDYTRKTQAVAHLQKEYGKVDEMFAPHRETMRQKGFTPSSLIEAWANVEMKLAGGADSAVDVIKGLIGGYNIPREKIAAALGITAAPAPGGQQQTNGEKLATAVENGQIVQLPPAVEAELRALREQVGNFGQKFQTIEQREANERMAREAAEAAAVDNQVNQFKTATDDKGQPLHPHFEEVKDMMTSLAQGALASKQQPFPTLDQLYETAVYAHPATREKVLTAARQQEESKRVEEAKAKAAAARRAGSSVTGAPGAGQAPQGKQGSDVSIRDSLEAAFEDVA